MPTTSVPGKPRTRHARDEEKLDSGRGHFDDLPPGYGGDGGGDGKPELTPPPEGYRIGIWLALASVTMMFLALSSAYVFNSAYRPFLEFPSTFIVSTIIVLTSSVTLEISRRAVRRRFEGRFERWLIVTLVLGVGFLAAQMTAWFQLVGSGFYVNTNRHSGFAYIFTALHAIHVLGGIGALSFVLIKSRRRLWTAVRRRSAVGATAIYWHFLCALWLYILVMLFVWGR